MWCPSPWRALLCRYCTGQTGPDLSLIVIVNPCNLDGHAGGRCGCEHIYRLLGSKSPA